MSKADIHRLAQQQARQALAEDIGRGDLSAPLAPSKPVSARLICRQAAVLCGRLWFEACFQQIDDTADFAWRHQDGDLLTADSLVCRLTAQAAAILSAERSALNFMQTLSATATLAHRWQRAAGDSVKIVDTRKTLPLLRQAQKYAVRVGGAHNHRAGLYDEILIKENHILAAGGIAAVLQRAQETARRERIPPPQIEVRDFDELAQAIDAGAQRILLDNFSPAELEQAVAQTPTAIELEASGNITWETLPAIMASGVHRISVGALTKNVQAVDFSLLIDE